MIAPDARAGKSGKWTSEDSILRVDRSREGTAPMRHNGGAASQIR
jgi:hypothetical protein